jgi:hypothetical protein
MNDLLKRSLRGQLHEIVEGFTWLDAAVAAAIARTPLILDDEARQWAADEVAEFTRGNIIDAVMTIIEEDVTGGDDLTPHYPLSLAIYNKCKHGQSNDGHLTGYSLEQLREAADRVAHTIRELERRDELDGSIDETTLFAMVEAELCQDRQAGELIYFDVPVE